MNYGFGTGANSTLAFGQPVTGGSRVGNNSAVDFANGSAGNYDDWWSYWQGRAKKGDATAQEIVWNELSKQYSEKTSRDWTAMREDSQYQRLVKDLKAAGISPYVISGAAPAAASAPMQTRSDSSITSTENSKRTARTQADHTFSSVMGTIMSLIGTAIWIAALV